MSAERLVEFVKYCDMKSAERWERLGYTYAPAPTHEMESGPRWAKIYRVENGRRGSIVAFIALEGFSNKTLGTVKLGDIFKPASYQAPAKHARGNLQLQDFGDCFDGSCITYLR